MIVFIIYFLVTYLFWICGYIILVNKYKNSNTKYSFKEWCYYTGNVSLMTFLACIWFILPILLIIIGPFYLSAKLIKKIILK